MGKTVPHFSGSFSCDFYEFSYCTYASYMRSLLLVFKEDLPTFTLSMGWENCPRSVSLPPPRLTFIFVTLQQFGIGLPLEQCEQSILFSSNSSALPVFLILLFFPFRHSHDLVQFMVGHIC